MEKYKRLTCLFAALAILLSDVMCAVVAYDYCALQWGGRYECWSAPASVAFLYCVPYGLGIVICCVLAAVFHRKGRNSL